MGSYTEGLFKRGRLRSVGNQKEYQKVGKESLTFERLTACAIIRGGETHSYGFKSHGDIRRKLGDVDWSKSYPGDQEGFLTSEGRFVDRHEANLVGVKAGQCMRMDRKFLSSDVNGW